MKLLRPAILTVIAVAVISMSLVFQRVRPLARSGHAAVLMPDGRVLILGGRGRDKSVLILNAMEAKWCSDHLPESLSYIWIDEWVPRNNYQFYDPKTNDWKNGGEIPNIEFINDVAVLPNGQVIAGYVAKGQDLESSTTIVLSSDSTLHSWIPVSEPLPDAGPGPVTRSVADRIEGLSRGRVLLNSMFQGAIYDSATLKWTPVDGAPAGGNLVQIDDDRVFSTGDGYSAILDLKSIRWSKAPFMGEEIDHYSASSLPNGKILVVGGIDTNSEKAETSCRLFDPGTGKWSPTGSNKVARCDCSLVALKTGKVLAIGGLVAGNGPICELYDPANGTWRRTGGIGQDRYDFTATLLEDGRVFVFGGRDNMDTKDYATGEIYDPATEKWTEVN